MIIVSWCDRPQGWICVRGTKTGASGARFGVVLRVPKRSPFVHGIPVARVLGGVGCGSTEETNKRGDKQNIIRHGVFEQKANL